MKYECPCGYIYDPALGDPDSGIDPGTAWEDVPEDWVAPSAASARICSHQPSKTEKSNRRGKSLSCFAVIIFTPRW